jgi:hypothetical protein
MEKDSTRPAGCISSVRRSILFRYAEKPPPTISRTKKPAPLVKPIPAVPLAVITPVKPGETTNATDRITRPNPVVRRGRKWVPSLLVKALASNGDKR